MSHQLYDETRNKVAAAREQRVAELVAENGDLRKLARDLSDTLLLVAPLGGSECFMKRLGEHYADPKFFRQRIEENHQRFHEAMKRAISAERAMRPNGA